MRNMKIKSGFAFLGVIVVIVGLLIIGGGTLYSYQTYQNKRSDVNNILHIRETGSGLNQYFNLHKQYPLELSSIVNNEGAIDIGNGGIVLVGKNAMKQAEFFNDLKYKTSDDFQHFILWVSLVNTKDFYDKVTPPLEKIDGVIYGVNCSNHNIYCLNETTTRQQELQTKQEKLQQIIISNLNSGTAYSYKIRARDKNGISKIKENLSFTTK